MKFCLSWISVVPTIMLGSVIAKDLLSNNNKYFLKYKENFCLYPENAIEENRLEIASDECDKIAHEYESKIIWLYYDDGHIRTSNGLCLKTFKNFVVVSSCSPNPNDNSEKWKIDSEKHLKNEMNQCAQIAGNKLFSFNCNKLSTKEFELKSFSEEELNIMKTRYAQKKLKNMDQTHILNLQEKTKSVLSTYNDLEKEIEYMILNEVEMEKEKQNINNLMDEVKWLLDTSSALKEYGTGALMIVYDNINVKKKQSLLKLPLEKLEINESLLNEYGLNNSDIKIVIYSFLNVPEESNYTFVAKNIKGDLIIKIENNEIISNNNISLDTEITSPLIHLPKNKLIPINIEISSTTEKPSFSLYWSSKNLPEQIITSMYLYTTVYEKVCYPPVQKKIDCSYTFENVQKHFMSEEIKEMNFLCPPECLAPNKYPILKKKKVLFPLDENCYDLNSSICGSAAESNFVSNDFGGSIHIMIKEVKDGNGNTEKCGIVEPSIFNDSTFEGITDIKLVDMDDFFTNFEANKNIYKGYKGIVTDDNHALLSKTDSSKRYIVDIDLKCEGYSTPLFKNKKNENTLEIDTEDELNEGYFVVKRGKSLDIINNNESIVVDAFALFDKYNEKKVDINIPGWSRKSCNNIQLFLKYRKTKDFLTYPSVLLSCNDTFEMISFENSTTLNARCLPFCETDKPVIGSFIYSSTSPVCKSAIHSGVITQYGGVIEITKLENITQHFQNMEINTITRNNVEAIIKNDDQSNESYYISKPTGVICNYPRNSFNINESISSDETWKGDEKLERNDANNFWAFSFIQMDTPPASLVTMKHAMLQDQLHKLHNIYNRDEYKQRYFSNSATERQVDEKETTNNINPYKNANTGYEKDEKTEADFLQLKEGFQKDKENLQNLSIKTQSIFANLLKKNENFNTLSNKLSNIRIAQKNHEDFLRIHESSILSLIKQFKIITSKKKKRIFELEKALKEVQPLTVETFKETYATTNINNNYFIIDSIHNLNGPSKWKIEKYTKGNFVSAITNDSLIKSNEFLYGTCLINRHVKMCKGFITVDVKIPYEGNIGIVFKYKNHKNYNNFIINRRECYFVEVKEGSIGEKINQKDINDTLELGNWTKIMIDFGYKNIRVYLNEKFISGYKTEVHDCGLLGFGINNANEKVLFDKIVIGSLDQAKYYKQTLMDPTSVNKKKEFDMSKEILSFIKETEKETGKIDVCKPFEETFFYPLETNWIVQENSNWRIKQKFNFHSIISKKITEDAYLFSEQTGEGDIITPSIILLKTMNFCNNMHSYSFQILINVEKSSKAGILFRVLSSVDFLSIVIDASGALGKIYLLKISEGIPYQLLTPTHIPIKQNTWYNLKLNYNGTLIYVVLNNETVLKVNVEESMKELGNVGLIVLRGQAQFKNIHFIPNNDEVH